MLFIILPKGKLPNVLYVTKKKKKNLHFHLPFPWGLDNFERHLNSKHRRRIINIKAIGCCVELC